MTSAWELYEATRLIIGVDKMARALGISAKHAYRLCQPPLSDETPDGNGSRSDVDRFELMIDVLAAHPAGRAVLRRWRLRFDALFARALDHQDATTVTRMTDAGLVERLGQLTQEENGAEAKENERESLLWRDGDVLGLADASRREIEKMEERIAVLTEMHRRGIDPRTATRQQPRLKVGP